MSDFTKKRFDATPRVTRWSVSLACCTTIRELSAPENGRSLVLAGALADLTARPAATTDLPLGRSPRPRPLPLDGELKIISHTPVEDLIAIPS